MNEFGTALVSLITPDNMASVIVMALFFRVGWRATDIMLDALELWFRKILGAPDGS